jgi:hypothetical protein
LEVSISVVGTVPLKDKIMKASGVQDLCDRQRPIDQPHSHGRGGLLFTSGQIHTRSLPEVLAMSPFTGGKPSNRVALFTPLPSPQAIADYVIGLSIASGEAVYVWDYFSKRLH